MVSDDAASVIEACHIVERNTLSPHLGEDGYVGRIPNRYIK